MVQGKFNLITNNKGAENGKHNDIPGTGRAVFKDNRN